MKTIICIVIICIILADNKANDTNEQLDLPVSLAIKQNKKRGFSLGLEKSNKVNRWLTRLIKKDDYFEIPNLPLNGQIDLEKITHIDADQRMCTSSEIRDQKQCGACYAFSWLSYVEWHYCKQTGEHIDLSEQHLIDCGKKARLAGCQSGYLPETIDFSQMFGFELEQNYPYQGKELQCKQEQTRGSTLMATIDAKRLKFNREQWERVLDEQPILVQVHLPNDIELYSRGIHPGNNCNENKAHGMLLVGYGRQEGRPYWLLRNSMGFRWGENGYLRLSREAQVNCMRTGFLARIKFKQIDDDLYHDFYNSLKFKPNLVPI